MPTPNLIEDACHLLVPRRVWKDFIVSRTPVASTLHALVAYRGPPGLRGPVIVTNEDLWVDKKNPFLLTKLELCDDSGGHDSRIGLGLGHVLQH